MRWTCIRAQLGTNIEVYNLQGRKARHYVSLPDMALGSLKGSDMPVLVDDEPRVSQRIDGIWRRTFSSKFDLDFDFAQRTLNLVMPDHCPNDVVYWANTYADADFDLRNSHIVLSMKLDGKDVTATLDTGSVSTHIFEGAARRLFDIDYAPPGLIGLGNRAPYTSDWMLHVFTALSIGGLAVNNPPVFILPTARRKASPVSCRRYRRPAPRNHRHAAGHGCDRETPSLHRLPGTQDLPDGRRRASVRCALDEPLFTTRMALLVNAAPISYILPAKETVPWPRTGARKAGVPGRSCRCGLSGQNCAVGGGSASAHASAAGVRRRGTAADRGARAGGGKARRFCCRAAIAPRASASSAPTTSATSSASSSACDGADLRRDVPVVKIGRMAGQFAKPRSDDNETRDGTVLPSYRGDIVNGEDFTAEARIPRSRAHAAGLLSGGGDGQSRAGIRGRRLCRSHAARGTGIDDHHHPDLKQRYEQVVDRIDEGVQFMRAFGLGDAVNPQTSTVDFYFSHEALLLQYEEALTRQDSITGDWYDTSGHMIWIGDRTRQPESAHVEFCRGVRNPIGLKCGPTLSEDDLVRLLAILNPENKPGASR